MERIDNLLEKYVESINKCDTELAREIWDKEGSVSFIFPKGRAYGRIYPNPNTKILFFFDNLSDLSFFIHSVHPIITFIVSI